MNAIQRQKMQRVDSLFTPMKVHYKGVVSRPLQRVDFELLSRGDLVEIAAHLRTLYGVQPPAQKHQRDRADIGYANAEHNPTACQRCDYIKSHCVC